MSPVHVSQLLGLPLQAVSRTTHPDADMEDIDGAPVTLYWSYTDRGWGRWHGGRRLEIAFESDGLARVHAWHEDATGNRSTVLFHLSRADSSTGAEGHEGPGFETALCSSEGMAAVVASGRP